MSSADVARQMADQAVRALRKLGCDLPETVTLAEAAASGRRWIETLRKGHASTKAKSAAAISVIEAASAVLTFNGDEQLVAAIALGERYAGLEMALSKAQEAFIHNLMRLKKAGRSAGDFSHEFAQKWVAQALEIAERAIAEDRSIATVAATLRKVRSEMAAGSHYQRPPGDRAMRNAIGPAVMRMIEERDISEVKSPRRRRRQPG